MMDARGENLAFWFSRAQENAFLDAFSKEFVFVPQMFFVLYRNGGAIVYAPAPQLRGPCFPTRSARPVE